MKEILKYLRLNGEKLDSEIAVGIDMSIADVQRGLSELVAKGKLITCQVTQLENGKKIKGTLYRASAYIPPPASGRKSKAQLVDSQKGREVDEEE